MNLEGSRGVSNAGQERAVTQEPVFLGIDIGSSTTKCCLVSGEGELVGHTVINTYARHDEAIAESLRLLEEQHGVSRDHLRAVVGTGYGRDNIDFADKQMTELFCHCRGAHHVNKAARMVIDIGGQDSKVVRLGSNGEMVDFTMNEKCAAGTGKFLEAMARTLGRDLEEFATLDAQAQKELSMTTICTVFAESEVISYIAKGHDIPDVVRAIHNSIAQKVGGMVRRLSAVSEVVMTGGVARNQGVVQALEREVGMPVWVAPNPQIMGALGAALFAKDLGSRR